MPSSFMEVVILDRLCCEGNCFQYLIHFKTNLLNALGHQILLCMAFRSYLQAVNIYISNEMLAAYFYSSHQSSTWGHSTQLV